MPNRRIRKQVKRTHRSWTVNDSLSKETQKTQETKFINSTMRTLDFGR